MNQPLKWHGGKHYLAPWIISHFPKHIHYVEPYFGGGSVLLQKPFKDTSEVINDIHGELMNFWSVLASCELFPQLQILLEVTPFSQPLFDQVELPLSDTTYNPQVLRALAFFIRARQSRQGLMKDFATLSRNRTRRGMNEQVSSWLTAIEGLPEVHARLQRVVILNEPALRVIDSQDGTNTLFYLDPPYLHETRSTTKDYAHEMTPDDHKALLQKLATIKGKFVLSGYHSKLYTDIASQAGWSIDHCEIDNKASSSGSKELKTECLWMNFDWRKNT